MSRGLGRVQNRCISAIALAERKGGKGELPDTYDIVAHVYGIRPDADGAYLVTDAQHVAVKRALAGLQRKAMIIGFDRFGCGYPFDLHDGRRNHGYCWMSEGRARRWIREQGKSRDGFVKTFKAKMAAIGMKAPK